MKLKNRNALVGHLSVISIIAAGWHAHRGPHRTDGARQRAGVAGRGNAPAGEALNGGLCIRLVSPRPPGRT